MNKYDATLHSTANTYINSAILRANSFAFKFTNEPAFKVKWGMFAIACMTTIALISGAAHTDDTAQALVAQIHQDSVSSK